jgi:GTP-binding protein
MEKKMKQRSVVVSVIGRPNVGKSTIFNRLMRKSFKAMTFDRPGVTRDRHYGIVTLEDSQSENFQDLIVVDTGGFYPERVEEEKIIGKRKTAEPFFNLMADHAKLAIDESDLVLFVVDVREGLLPFDKTIADYIRTTKKPMWLLVNKYDTDKQMGDEAEFYQLGVDEEQLMLVSAEHGLGLETLRERLYDFAHDFNTNDEIDIQKGVKPRNDVVSNVAIIGAPNAGKSTLLNRLIGAQRALVSDVAGTTVDPIEGYIDLMFGSDAEKLGVHENQFRKDNRQLFDEFKKFEKELDAAEMLAYDQLPDDVKVSDDDFDDDSEDAFEKFNESEAIGLDSQDLFSVEDMSHRVEIDEVEDGEVEDDEDVSLKELEQSELSTDASTINSEYNPWRSIKIVDTAGIRKRGMVKGFIEEQSVYRSLRAISECDVVLYMVDVTKGITHQDRRLCDIALEKGKSILICLNKVDLIAETVNDHKKKREWLLDLRATIPWLGFCELITISAKNGRYLKSLKKSLVNTIMIRNQKVTTSKLNKVVSELVDRHPIVLQKSAGVRFRVKYASMIKTAPPTFLLFTNKSKGIPANYRKFLMNGIRREFEYKNTPVHLIFRTASDIERRMRKMGKNS